VEYCDTPASKRKTTRPPRAEVNAFTQRLQNGGRSHAASRKALHIAEHGLDEAVDKVAQR